jgi:hypothetical protein
LVTVIPVRSVYPQAFEAFLLHSMSQRVPGEEIHELYQILPGVGD